MPQDQTKQLTPTEPQELLLDDFREKARERYGIPKPLWESLRSQESGRNIDAVSPTGVRGEFQLTQGTARGMGLDRDDPFHQIVGAAKNLREGYDKYSHLKDDNQRWLAAAGYYYGGPDAVKSDGTLSDKSKDGISNPQAYVTKIAQRWKSYNDSQSVQATVTTKPQPVEKALQPVTPQSLTTQRSRPMTGNERRLASDEVARRNATPQIARMVEDFEALKREGSLDAARSVVAKIKQQYGKWMEVGDGTGGWPYVKSKVQGWNPVQPASPVTTPSLEDERAAFAQKPMLEQITERAVDAYARGGGQVSKMLRQGTGAQLGAMRGLVTGNYSPIDIPAWREGEEARMRNLEERRKRRSSSFVSDVGEGIVEAVPSAAGAILGTMATGGGLPAAMVIGGGMGAGADWRDPKRALTQTALGAVAPMAGGKAGAVAGQALASRFANRALQAASRAGGELLGGGLGNVIGSGAEQLAFDGGLNQRELAKQFIVGSALNVPGAVGAARTPASMPISGLSRANVEPNIQAPTGRTPFQRPANPVDQAIADFGNRLFEIEQMVPLNERPAAIEAARQEFNVRRRQVALMPQGPARQPAAAPEAVPGAPAVRPAPALPEGVQVVRQGEPVPPLQSGQRQIAMDLQNPDGTSETVRVVFDRGINERSLRSMVEQSLLPQAQPVAQGADTGPPPLLQEPQQPAPARRQPTPIQFTQLGPEGLRGRTPGGGYPMPRSPLPSRKLLGSGRPEDVPTEALPPRPQAERVPTEPITEDMPPAPERRTAGLRPQARGGALRQTAQIPRVQADAVPTQRFPEPVYPDAPETQEMPAIRERIAAENATTRGLPAVPLERRTTNISAAPVERRTAIVPRQPQAPPTRRTGEISPAITQEPTNRITSGEGAELPRRVSRPLEGQLVQMERQMPTPPSRPGGGRLPRPLEGRMYSEFPGDRRAMVVEGRRVGGEIEAGRGEKGEFGKIAQQMFKSTSGEVPHGQDAFFHDPAVKGALGLSRDAEMGEVRAELKKELARSMGVKADEISLTQVGPNIWKRWARQKGLRGDAVTKMNTAIERYQKGVISDIEKTAQAEAEQPSERAGEVPKAAEAAETGRKIQHSKFGAVTEVADQSGVRKGYMRVTDDATGKTHIIKNPRTRGGGNREAAFVKTEPPNLVQRMSKLARTPTSPVDIAKLRAEFPDMSKTEFDAEMIKLNEQGRIALHRHDQPTEADRATAVKIGDDYFTAATFREGKGHIMGFGLGALQGMFGKRKPPKANSTRADIESAGLGRTLGNLSKGVGNEMRTLMTAIDFGAVGAQGFWLSASNPVKAINSSAKMFRSMSRTQSDAIDAEIAFHPLRNLWEKSEMYTATGARLKGSKAGGEEAFRGILAEAPVVRGFERAYRTYLDTMRVAVFESYAKALQKQGITFENNPKAYKDAAAFINIATGRGQLKKGGMLEKGSDILGAVAFAPRNLISNFQLLDPVRYARMEPAARKLALKDSLTTVGAMVGTALLLRQAGVNVGFNPENDDFMIARAGNTRYDLTFGKKTQIQFLARLIMGAYRKATGEGNLPNKDPLSIAKKFAEGKASPLISTALTLGSGQTFEGKKLADMSKGELAWETGPVPILLKDLVDVYRQEGKAGVAKTLPAIIGTRVNTYPDRAKAAFLDIPPEVRAEQKQFGKTRPYLSPRRNKDDRAKDETPAQFATRRTQANEWNAKYGSQLVGSDSYKNATKEEKALALDYLKSQIAEQSGEKRPSLYLLTPRHIFQTIRESERRKRRKAEGAM